MDKLLAEIAMVKANLETAVISYQALCDRWPSLVGTWLVHTDTYNSPGHMRIAELLSTLHTADQAVRAAQAIER